MFTELNDDSGILLFLGVVGLKRTWDEVVFYFDFAHVHDCLLYGVNAACPGACHNNIGAYSCTCPIGYGSMEEDGKPICGLVVCGVPQSDICAFATLLARYLLANGASLV